MKKYALLGLVAALAGCQSMTTTSTNPASTLNAYSWQLIQAHDAQGQRIQSLFVQPEKPLTISFTGNRIHISNACNQMGGQYTLNGHQLNVTRLVSTMMLCPTPLNQIDQAISTRLEKAENFQITQNSHGPLLTLTTAGKDQLIWQGIPTPETKYGSQADTIFLEISPQTKPCDAGSHQMECLQVREIHYNEQGLKTETSGWQNFYTPIEGYTHSDKERVILRVKKYAIKNPPADSSNTKYILDMYVEREQVK